MAHGTGRCRSSAIEVIILIAVRKPLLDWLRTQDVRGLRVLQIVTDVLFSTKSSDWKKFRRERAVAKYLRHR